MGEDSLQPQSIAESDAANWPSSTDALHAFYSRFGLDVSPVDLDAVIPLIRAFDTQTTETDARLVTEPSRDGASTGLVKGSPRSSPPSASASSDDRSASVVDVQADMAYLSIRQVARLFARRELSPIELLDQLLRRTAVLNPRLHAYINVMEEQAVEAAKAAERAILSGDTPGSLCGIPLAIKDLVDVEGVVTSAGSPILRDSIASADSATVERLKTAGAVITGKTNLPEFGYTAPPFTSDAYPDARNPWDVERTAGGSSSGSAVALAAGLVPAAIGSDTGGSIRIPSHLCGVVGLKPTHGRVSTYGVVPLSPSLDHVGPMARTVEDAAHLLGAIAGYDPRDPCSVDVPASDYVGDLDKGISGLKVGVIREYLTGDIDPEVEATVEVAIRVLEKLGAKPCDVEFPLAEELVHPSAILLAEAAQSHLNRLRKGYSLYTDGVRRKLLLGLAVPVTAYQRSHAMRKRMINDANNLLRHVDVLVSPTMPIAATRNDATSILLNGKEVSPTAQIVRYTRAYNVTGFPAISIPCGFTTDGMPVGLQIGGRPMDEATVFRVAHAYERETEWGERRPNVQ